jgi:hypothetical protein
MLRACVNTTVEGWIARFIADSSTNSLHDGTGSRAWDAPLVGFAKGDDPLFEFLHEDIGSFYWTPLSAFRAAFSTPAAASELSVIAWVLPQTRRAKQENGNRVDAPAESWARSRHYGEICNDALRKHLVDSSDLDATPGLPRYPGTERTLHIYRSCASVHHLHRRFCSLFVDGRSRLRAWMLRFHKGSETT